MLPRQTKRTETGLVVVVSPILRVCRFMLWVCRQRMWFCVVRRFEVGGALGDVIVRYSRIQPAEQIKFEHLANLQLFSSIIQSIVYRHGCLHRSNAHSASPSLVASIAAQPSLS